MLGFIIIINLNLSSVESLTAPDGSKLLNSNGGHAKLDSAGMNTQGIHGREGNSSHQQK